MRRPSSLSRKLKTDRDTYVSGDLVTVTFAATQSLRDEVAAGEKAFLVLAGAFTDDLTQFEVFVAQETSSLSATMIAHD